jgi:hypothetical protein
MNGITVENLLEQIQQLSEGDKLLLHNQLSKLMISNISSVRLGYCLLGKVLI